MIRIDCPEKGKDCYIRINLREWQFDFAEEDDDENYDADEDS